MSPVSVVEKYACALSEKLSRANPRSCDFFGSQKVFIFLFSPTAKTMSIRLGILDLAGGVDFLAISTEPKRGDKYPVSLVIITLNESENIEPCLRSALLLSEIVVLDSA